MPSSTQSVENVASKKWTPDFYFWKYEHRRPPEPVPYSAAREFLWQFLALSSIFMGARYLWWRWTASLNFHALWFAIPVIVAESLSFIGLILFVINLWKTEDYPAAPPPSSIRECLADQNIPDRPARVDVFFPTYNEDPELVRLSVRDAKKLTYPGAIEIRIYVLDDGKRESMRRVAEEEEVGYLTRTGNEGFKAGNLRSGMEQTSGDFLVICDADTRPFPTFLEHTLGYFRDPDVAWVQTPQWFYDLPEGVRLARWLGDRAGRFGEWFGAAVEWVAGPIHVGQDIFGSDPTLFYDAILRRRNWANASFCCGAGSIHRREAVMQAALRRYTEAIDAESERLTEDATIEEFKSELKRAIAEQMILEEDVTPYKYHVSEDIYTSIALHSDRARTWKSVFHPSIESKMLSPQDLLTVTIQRFKYAGGTMDILLHDNPLFRRGLRWPQKVMYGATMWSYLSCIWLPVFLLAPIVYFFTGLSPVAAYSAEFYRKILPFLILNELAMMIGLWGLPSWRGKALYLSLVPLNLRALITVLRKKKIGFPVTPKIRQEGNFARVVPWQIGLIAVTYLGMVYSGMRMWFGDSSNLSAWLVNVLWASYNVVMISGLVWAAFWKPEDDLPEQSGVAPSATEAK
jgi:cellulose synthase (UDP-forming)